MASGSGARNTSNKEFGQETITYDSERFFRSTSNTDEPDNCRTISISNSDEPGNYSTMSTAQLQRTCLIEQIKAAIAQRKAAEAQERAALKYLQDSQKEKDYINLTPM